MKIEQRMTRKPVTCRPEDTAHRAAKLMWDGDCGVLPVVGPGSKLVGMITDRDLLMAAWSRDRRLADIRVSEVMTTEPATCKPDEPIEHALELLHDRRVRRLPVVNARGALVGILTLGDLVKHALESTEPEERDQVLETFGTLLEPHTVVVAPHHEPTDDERCAARQVDLEC